MLLLWLDIKVKVHFRCLLAYTINFLLSSSTLLWFLDLLLRSWLLLLSFMSNSFCGTKMLKTVLSHLLHYILHNLKMMKDKNLICSVRWFKLQICLMGKRIKKGMQCMERWWILFVYRFLRSLLSFDVSACLCGTVWWHFCIPAGLCFPNDDVEMLIVKFYSSYFYFICSYVISWDLFLFLKVKCVCSTLCLNI